MYIFIFICVCVFLMEGETVRQRKVTVFTTIVKMKGGLIVAYNITPACIKFENDSFSIS